MSDVRITIREGVVIAYDRAGRVATVIPYEPQPDPKLNPTSIPAVLGRRR